MEWSNPLRGRTLHVKIKRKPVTKKKFIKASKPNASEMVKIRSFLQQTFQTFLKLVLVEKWFDLLYLLYQLSNYHSENVLGMDLRTQSLSNNQTKKNEHDKNIFRKVFQKPWNSFRILSSVSMKYCSMSIEKTLLMYRVCINKRPRERYDSAWQIFK